YESSRTISHVPPDLVGFKSFFIPSNTNKIRSKEIVNDLLLSLEPTLPQRLRGYPKHIDEGMGQSSCDENLVDELKSDSRMKAKILGNKIRRKFKRIQLRILFFLNTIFMMSEYFENCGIFDHKKSVENILLKSANILLSPY
ncbi:hypothetical protein HK096_001246, partial [Nowakowskiella sp. JEL0078]